MQVKVTKPEVERFIEAQVRAGHFSSAEALVEAGVARLMSDAADGIDAETLDAIDRSEDQIDSGEVRDWKAASTELRKTFLGR